MNARIPDIHQPVHNIVDQMLIVSITLDHILVLATLDMKHGVHIMDVLILMSVQILLGTLKLCKK